MTLALRQTVFYTPDTLTVSQGDHITGELTCRPNARNPRDLDITIKYEAPHEASTEIHYKMCVLLPAHCLMNRGYSERTLTNCQVLINFSDTFCLCRAHGIIDRAPLVCRTLATSPKITGIRACVYTGTRHCRRCCRLLHLSFAISCVTRRGLFLCCMLEMQLCLCGIGPGPRTLTDCEHVQWGRKKIGAARGMFQWTRVVRTGIDVEQSFRSDSPQLGPCRSEPTNIYCFLPLLCDGTPP